MSANIVDPLSPVTPEFLQNPYPAFERLRNEAPIFWSEKGKYWVVSRYADVNGILRDLHYEKKLQRWNQVNPLVRAGMQLSSSAKSRSQWMLNQNPPDHTRLRSLVNKAFTPTRVQAMRAHIEEIADSLLDAAAEKGHMDVVADYAFPLPVTVIAEMLGVPASDRDLIKNWSNTLVGSLEPSFDLKKIALTNKATEDITDYLRPLLAERRKNPKDDLISTLAYAEEEGKHLTEDELLSNCVLLLVAGHETTVNLIANSFHLLLTHADQLELLKQKPELLGTAINEFLRYESPVQMVRRLAGGELELHGHKIKEMDMLVLLLGSANRDADAFPNADKLDISRTECKHLAFGFGIHHCVGSSLAEVEGQIAISSLLKRFPNIKMTSSDVTFKEPFTLRGPKSLPVSL